MSKREKPFQFNRNKHNNYISYYLKNFLELHSCALKVIEELDASYSKVLDDFLSELKRLSLKHNDRISEAVDYGFDYKNYMDRLKAEAQEFDRDRNPEHVEMGKQLYNNILDEMIKNGLSIRSENYIRTMYGL